MKWARMSFKPTKSRSVVLKKGRVSEYIQICILNRGYQIPTITENPVKSLGKIFDATLKYKAAIRDTCGECEQEVDRSGLPGRFKTYTKNPLTWYRSSQFPLLPKLR